MLLLLGEPEAALELVTGLAPGDVQLEPILAIAYHALGDTEKSATSIRQIEQMEGPRRHSFLAEVYAFTGDIDRAYEELEKESEISDELKYNLFLSHWENLRGDPRWTALREQLGMSEEQVGMLDFSPVLQYER